MTEALTDQDTQQTAAPFAGKSPELISLGDGLNFSAPLARVEGTVVPAPLFFLRSNYQPPTNLDAQSWSLRIEGKVQRPLRVGLADLQARGQAVTQEVWLECAGNSRRRFDPPAEGNQWDDQAVSNAVFTGLPLRVLLDEAGPEPGAIELVTTGADSPQFQRGLPLDIALRPSVLLAWEMNGQPLLPANGGPVRLVVPGWAGIASVKWPALMEVVDTPFQGYYNKDRYVIVDADGRTLRTVREMPVKSVIAWPGQGETLAAGQAVTLFGFAWSGHGAIERVEVSTDGQQTWSAAELRPGSGPLAWTRWELRWTPPAAGQVRIAARATDAAGHVQPAAPEWNVHGYQNNSITTREVQVR